jgi:hypothetical protein
VSRRKRVAFVANEVGRSKSGKPASRICGRAELTGDADLLDSADYAADTNSTDIAAPAPLHFSLARPVVTQDCS